MIADIFKFEDYKIYLAERIHEDSKVTKGLRLKLSNYVGCQQSYLSQVLNGKPHFTLEQAHLVNHFFVHDKLEAKYFILLVEYARAGTTALREFFFEDIKEMRRHRYNLKKRLREIDELPETVIHKYYSAWFYSAIHVILSIPEYQNPGRVAEHLHLPLKIVMDVIHFLMESGLIENKNGKYQHTKKRIHLDKESVAIHSHHINWRSQVLQSVEKNLPEDFHYSNVFAIAESDFNEIRELFLKAIVNARNIIGPSKEEAVYAMAIDIFKV